LLQKIVASQENQHIASHATIFCNQLAKVLQKIVAYENQHITSHATIFCNQLANVLQKIVASQENQHIASHADPEIPDLKMLIRARNAVWMSKRAIGIRGFRGLLACDYLL
jgi:competence protein ComGF